MDHDAEGPVGIARVGGDAHRSKPAHADFAETATGLQSSWNCGPAVDPCFAGFASGDLTPQCGGIDDELIEQGAGRARIR